MEVIRENSNYARYHLPVHHLLRQASRTPLRRDSATQLALLVKVESCYSLASIVKAILLRSSASLHADVSGPVVLALHHRVVMHGPATEDLDRRIRVERHSGKMV